VTSSIEAGFVPPDAQELTKRLLQELAIKVTEHERDRCVGILNAYATELLRGAVGPVANREVALIQEAARRLRAKS
jgi:hypothetical protein